MIMASGVNFGIAKSLPHYLGICIGFPAMVALVGFGLGFVFERYPAVHVLITLVGIAYLLYLAWRIANAAPTTLEANEARPISFWQAAIFQWVNPKAWIMATGAVATYTLAATDIYTQVLVIALVFFLVAFPCVGFWLFFGVWLKRYMNDATHQRTFNICMAILLVISIFPIIYDLLKGHFS